MSDGMTFLLVLAIIAGYVLLASAVYGVGRGLGAHLRWNGDARPPWGLLVVGWPVVLALWLPAIAINWVAEASERAVVARRERRALPRAKVVVK